MVPKRARPKVDARASFGDRRLLGLGTLPSVLKVPIPARGLACSHKNFASKDRYSGKEIPLLVIRRRGDELPLCPNQPRVHHKPRSDRSTIAVWLRFTDLGLRSVTHHLLGIFARESGLIP
jgi:hypothetical protein